MPIYPERAERVFGDVFSNLVPNSMMKMNIEGREREVDLRRLMEMTRKMIERVDWVTRTPENELDFITSGNAFGRLTLGLPKRWEITNILLPRIMNGDELRAVLGVEQIHVRKVENEWCFLKHIQEYGDKARHYYFDWNMPHPSCLTLYEGNMRCVYPSGKSRQFDVREFETDDWLSLEFKNITNERSRQRKEGALYQALYTAALLPDEAFDIFEQNGGLGFQVGNFVLRPGKEKWILRETDTDVRFGKVAEFVDVRNFPLSSI